MNTEADFWSKFSPEPNTGCWLWTGSVSNQGRGKFMFQRRTWGVHRLAYTLTRGPVHADMFVCHSCDNGHLGCGNPDHLWLGTPKDNTLDALRKGRLATGERSGFKKYPEKYGRGENHPNSKLTHEQVRGIKRRLLAGETASSIARCFGLDRSTIGYIKTGKHYAQVSP